MTNETAMVPAHESRALEPLSAEAMERALSAYRDLQGVLDRGMPDALMEIQGKTFRKKAYWRAVATAFHLDVSMVAEKRGQTKTDWGWSVTYRATAQSGRFADGDGTCMASEKPGRGQATEHNVRSHAHTRAFNRAVSNLVGFGEVSAEEVQHDEPAPSRAREPQGTAASQTPAAAPPPGDHTTVTKVFEKQGTTADGKAWTRYDVHFASGVKAATFSAPVGDMAHQAKREGRRVAVTVERKGQHLNIVDLALLPMGPAKNDDEAGLYGDPRDEDIPF